MLKDQNFCQQTWPFVIANNPATPVGRALDIIIFLNFITGYAQQVSVCLSKTGRQESANLGGRLHYTWREKPVQVNGFICTSQQTGFLQNLLKGVWHHRAFHQGAPAWALLQTPSEEQSKHPPCTEPDVFWRWNKVSTVPQRGGRIT